jgi:hypothetical protein
VVGEEGGVGGLEELGEDEEGGEEQQEQEGSRVGLGSHQREG